MNKNLFEKVLGSVKQASEIIRGTQPPSREFHVDGTQIREVRAMKDNSQAVPKAQAE